MKKIILASVIFALLSAMLPSMPANALYVEYTNKLQFPKNNSVDWGQFGAVNTVVPSGSVATATLFGTTVTVSTGTATDLERLDQGSGWTGNFSPGDHLLYTQNATTIILDFAIPVWSAGAQIQTADFGRFYGRLRTYDINNNLLDSFIGFGNSTPDANDSALFMGIFSDGYNIRRLEFSTLNSDNDQPVPIAINKLLFLQCPQCPPPSAPLPGSLLLLSSGCVLGFIGLRRKIS